MNSVPICSQYSSILSNEWCSGQNACFGNPLTQCRDFGHDFIGRVFPGDCNIQNIACRVCSSARYYHSSTFDQKNNLKEEFSWNLISFYFNAVMLTCHKGYQASLQNLSLLEIMKNNLAIKGCYEICYGQFTYMNIFLKIFTQNLLFLRVFCTFFNGNQIKTESFRVFN